MASTPSASALSAVLRCQGNILARNQASKKRPAASVYALGKTCASPDRSYMRALLGFLFHGENLEIPGVVSVSTQFKSQSDQMKSEGKDHPDRRKIKLKRDYERVAYKYARYGLLLRSNAVLRPDDAHLWKIFSESRLRTLCICVMCAQRKSTMQNEMNTLFASGLVSLLKHKLIDLTAAVSGIVRTRLGFDRTNQLHPDCNKLGGCTQHKEDESETRLGKDSQPEE